MKTIISYLKEPVIRQHIFGYIQHFIALIIGWYLLFQQEDRFSICLVGFMLFSFIIGLHNIEKASNIIACNAFLSYLRLKNKNNKTEEERKQIDSFEESDLYKSFTNEKRLNP